MNAAKKLGERLKMCRMARGMSASDVAKLLGKTKQTIYRYEWGTTEPRYDDLPQFARIYGVTVAALVDPRHAATKLPSVPSPYNRGPAQKPGPGDEEEDDDEEQDDAAA